MYCKTRKFGAHFNLAILAFLKNSPILTAPKFCCSFIFAQLTKKSPKYPAAKTDFWPQNMLFRVDIDVYDHFTPTFYAPKWNAYYQHRIFLLKTPNLYARNSFLLKSAKKSRGQIFSFYNMHTLYIYVTQYTHTHMIQASRTTKVTASIMIMECLLRQWCTCTKWSD